MDAGVFSVAGAAFDTEDLLESSSGNSVFPVVTTAGFTTGSSTTLTIDVWYFIVGRRTDTNTWELYRGDETNAATLIGTATRSVSARAAATFAVLGARSTAGAAALTNADFDSLKVWTVALSAAEIETERLFQNAQRTTNLWAQVPFQTDGLDTSGNSRDFTLAGTPSYGTGPSINRGSAADDPLETIETDVQYPDPRPKYDYYSWDQAPLSANSSLLELSAYVADTNTFQQQRVAPDSYDYSWEFHPTDDIADQELLAPLFTNSSTLFDPSVNVTIEVPLLTNSSTLFDPNVADLNPPPIAGYTLWLDIRRTSTLYQDAARTTLAEINDPVGNWYDPDSGVSATQSSSARPIRGARGVVFDGVDDYLDAATGAGVTATSGATIVTVAQINLQTGALFGMSENTPGTVNTGLAITRFQSELYARTYSGPAIVVLDDNAAWLVRTWKVSDGAQKLWVNTSVAGTNTAAITFSPMQTLTIGRWFGDIYHLDGTIAMVLVYPTALSDSNIDSVIAWATTRHVSATLNVPLLPSTATLFTPTVSVGAVTLTVPLFTNSVTLFTPTVTVGAVTVFAPLITNGTSLFAPTVTQDAQILGVPLVTNTVTLFAPNVTVGAVVLSVPLLSDSASIFAPTVTLTVFAPLLVNTSVLFVPTLTVGSVTIVVPFLTSNAVLYAPSINSAYIYFAAIKQNRADLTITAQDIAALTIKPTDNGTLDIKHTDYGVL